MTYEFDTTKMSVDEIRSTLVAEFGYAEEVVQDVKGKKILTEWLLEAAAEADTVEDIDLGDTENMGDLEEVKDVVEETGVEIPLIGSYEWHDYIMAQFHDDEIYKGNPNASGLRRLVEKEISSIVCIQTNVLQVPTPENERRASAVVTVKLEDGSSYDGASDTFEYNTDAPYYKHPVASAETKAEGRAYKRALRLRNVNAAEEIATNAPEMIVSTILQDVENGPITTTQIHFIDLMCGKERLDINVEKLLESLSISKSALVHQDGLKIADALNMYQNKDNEIPKELIGYQPNWRN